MKSLDSYSQALGYAILTGEQLLEWLPKEQDQRMFALKKLAQAIDELQAQSQALEESSADSASPFLQAAGEMQAGCLLVAAGRAVENGDGTSIKAALETLKSEAADIKAGKVSPLFFEAELLQTPVLSANDQEALEVFKNRANRTLDNMVLEACDVIKVAVDKFKNDFDKFAKELGEIAKSFSEQGATGIIKAGVEKVISGLKMLAEFLKSDALKEAIKYVGDIVKNFDFEHILAAAFGCASTKDSINRLELRPSVNRNSLRGAGTRMAELSSRYVLLLKRARWVLGAVAAVGGLLVLTGVATQYAALGVPVAYAIVAVATTLIGMNFADSRMRGLIASL